MINNAESFKQKNLKFISPNGKSFTYPKEIAGALNAFQWLLC